VRRRLFTCVAFFHEFSTLWQAMPSGFDAYRSHVFSSFRDSNDPAVCGTVRGLPLPTFHTPDKRGFSDGPYS
jgi:hypothetical protein